jgi:hypothetical protein
MRQFRTPQPGDRAGRAADFRALANEVARLGELTCDGAAVESDAGGNHIILPPKPPAFWAELTDEPSADGWYAWVEVERSSLGTFSEVQYGRTWRDGSEPAREANGLSGLPTRAGTGGAGLYVWLELGAALPVTGGVIQEWVFRHGGGGGARAVAARVRNSTNVSVPSGGALELSFDTVLFDTGEFFSFGRFRIPAAGLYLFGGTVSWNNTTALGHRALFVKKNTNVNLSREEDAAFVGQFPNQSQTVSGMARLDQDDQLFLSVFQDSGQSLNVLAIHEYSPVFWILQVPGGLGV